MLFLQVIYNLNNSSRLDHAVTSLEHMFNKYVGAINNKTGYNQLQPEISLSLRMSAEIKLMWL